LARLNVQQAPRVSPVADGTQFVKAASYGSLWSDANDDMMLMVVSSLCLVKELSTLERIVIRASYTVRSKVLVVLLGAGRERW